MQSNAAKHKVLSLDQARLGLVKATESRPHLALVTWEVFMKGKKERTLQCDVLTKTQPGTVAPSAQ